MSGLRQYSMTDFYTHHQDYFLNIPSSKCTYEINKIVINHRNKYFPYNSYAVEFDLVFFFVTERLPYVVTHDVCPSVCHAVCPYICLSVSLSSVKIISFRGNLVPNRPIDLKIRLNVR